MELEHTIKNKPDMQFKYYEQILGGLEEHSPCVAIHIHFVSGKTQIEQR